MAGGDGDEFHVGTAGAEESTETSRVIWRHERVGGTIAQENSTPGERIRRGGLIQDNHGTE